MLWDTPSRKKQRVVKLTPFNPRIPRDPIVYSENAIASTKYTPWNFVPLCLFGQFRRLANCWYVLMLIIHLAYPDIPSVSIYDTLVPLVTVLTVSLLKELFEEGMRYLDDRGVNGREVQVLALGENGGSQLIWVSWGFLRPGDVVMIRKDNSVPADCVVLCSSDVENGGKAYVETAEFDGTVDVKRRSAPESTMSKTSGEQLIRLHCSVSCQPPCEEVTFDGHLWRADDQHSTLLTLENTVLRGQKLVKINWMIGLVIYAGQDTKLYQMRAKSFVERGRIQRNLNDFILAIISICVGCSILSANLAAGVTSDWTTGNIGLSTKNYMIMFLFLYNNLVPISLYAVLDLVRFMQTYILLSDNDLNSKTKKTLAYSSASQDDLGHVNLVFTDKTGTMTTNSMSLKACFVAQAGNFGLSQKRRGSNSKLNSVENHIDFNGSSMRCALVDRHDPFVAAFCQCVMVCHSSSRSRSQTENELQSMTSEDEALLRGMRSVGYEILYRGKHEIQYTTPMSDEPYSVTILDSCEFNSERKRMSVVIQKPCGTMTLYVKGADDVVLDQLADGQETEKSLVMQNINFAANRGLRTLVVASRELDESEAADFLRLLEHGGTCAANLEYNLTLLGAVAISDELCEGVPETIYSLKSSGICIWMLTGDKKETAVAVARSSTLMDSSFQVFDVCQTEKYLDPGKTRQFLSYLNSRAAEIRNLKTKHPVVVVVNGAALSLLNSRPLAMESFIYAVSHCSVVIACRMSPKQKSELVKMVHVHFVPPRLTLAIGDGGNDACMINEAHVGVAILRSKENIAVSAAAYSVSQFSNLHQLLHVHGRWNYNRSTTVVFYFIYKSVMLVSMQFIHTFYNNFSGTSLFCSGFQMPFDLLWTGLPVFALGMYHKDQLKDVLLENPALYFPIHEREFSCVLLMKWLVSAILSSVLIFELLILSPYMSIELVGTSSFIIIALVVNGKLILLMRHSLNYWIPLCVVASIGSGAIYVSSMDGVGLENSAPLTNVNTQLFYNVPFWLLVFVAITLCCLLEHVIDIVWTNFRLPCQSWRGVTTLRRRFDSWTRSRASFMECITEILVEYVAGGIREYIAMLTKVRCKSNTYKMNSVTLRFLDSDTEKSFRMLFVDRALKPWRQMLVCMTLAMTAWQIYDVAIYTQGRISVWVRLGILGCLCCAILATYVRPYRRHLIFGNYVFCLVGIIAKALLEIDAGQDGALTTVALPLLPFYVLRVPFWEACQLNAVHAFMFLMRYMLSKVQNFTLLPSYNVRQCQLSQGSFCSLLEYSPYFVGVLLLAGSAAYEFEISVRDAFCLRESLEQQRETTTNLLMNMMPEFVVDLIAKQGRLNFEVHKTIASSHAELTVLFCDVIGFKANADATWIVDTLDLIFKKFDRLCDTHIVSKVETVGTTFVACGGLEENIRFDRSVDKSFASEHAIRAMKVAFDMITAVTSLSSDKMVSGLHIKVGLNSGPVISGLVGTRKPQYALFGDTVNTAARMKSNGFPNKLHISESTYFLLESVHDMHSFRQHEISVKGKGQMTTYSVVQVLSARPSFGQSSLSSVSSHQFDAKGRNQETLTFEAGTKLPSLVSELHPIWRTFHCSVSEATFRDSYFTENVKGNYRLYQFRVRVLFVTYTLHSIALLLLVQQPKLDSSILFLVRTPVAFLLLLACIVTDVVKESLTYKNHVRAMIFIRAVTTIGFVITVWAPTKITTDTNALWVNYTVGLECLLWITSINIESGMPLKILFAINFSLMSFQFSALWYWYDQSQITRNFKGEFSLFEVCVVFLLIVIAYAKAGNDRIVFRQLERLGNLEDRCTQMLGEMLPKKIHEDIINGLPRMAYTYQNVCLLFSDIANFTCFSKGVKATTVVELVTALFSKIDHLSRFFGVYKVCTIGDCYVASAEPGNMNTVQNMRKMLAFSDALMRVLSYIKVMANNDLKMRSGLHLGSITGGVIGNKKLRYDIWGKDVLIANEVEANGIPNRIVISEQLKMFCNEMGINVPTRKHKIMIFDGQHYQLHIIRKFALPKSATNSASVSKRISANSVDVVIASSQKLFDWHGADIDRRSRTFWRSSSKVSNASRHDLMDL